MARETKVKNPADLPVDEKLKNLYSLQKVLSRIDEIRTIRGELPLEVQDLSDEIEGLTMRISKLEEEANGLRIAVNKWKEEKIQAQSVIDRNKEKIENVSNSREYDNLQKEVEYQELEIQLRDKRIREAAAKKQEIDDAIARYAADIEERKAELVVKKEELDEIIMENKVEEDKLRDESKELEEKIEPRLLTAYKRIRKSCRNGLGIVSVDRDSCGGCFAKIPPQRQLDVRLHKKVIVCEYCGRILIDPELAGIKVAKPQVEEDKKGRRKKATAKTAKKKEEA
ncbi:MAG: hypothetical protein ILA34_00380 [Bacteroidaceae bacterium]|nr:hypothetical protein [Bacteroidaceae bacterium]